MSVQVLHGDMLEQLATLEPASADSIVTDPPYGLSFMGRSWDHGVPGPDYWTACLRVLKPGGHLLAFGGTRTWHRQAVAIEDAGFEIRDSIMSAGVAWNFGSGFPKSLNVSRDRRFCQCADAHRVREPRGSRSAEQRAVESGAVSDERGPRAGRGRPVCGGCGQPRVPAGLGTALKPAWEPIVVARKPLSGTVAATVLAHGTGALNVDACRVGLNGERPPMGSGGPNLGTAFEGGIMHGQGGNVPPSAGRWPANVVLTHAPDCEEIPAFECVEGCPVAELDVQSGTSSSPGTYTRSTVVENHVFGASNARPVQHGHGDSGGASRFFPTFRTGDAGQGDTDMRAGAGRGARKDAPGQPQDDTVAAGHEPILPTFRYQAKAPTSERPKIDGVAHPTVKPLALMRWLVRLVTPPGGTVLDPFAGSGTTGEAALLEGFDAILIEREADYLPLIQARLERSA